MSDRKIPYAYVTGLSHSGSTLLAFLLNAHPELVSIGEAARVGEILPHRWSTRQDRCSCGKAFYYCEFWNRVLAGLAARGFGLREGDPFDAPDSRRAYGLRKWQAFTEAVLDVSGAGVFVDTSKVPGYVAPLRANPFLDLKVISLVRDGRGVVGSWLKRLPDARPEVVIETWISQENERSAALRSVDPERLLVVRYEDLCREPDRTLVNIFTHLLVEPAVDITAGYKSGVEHHVIGNQMRLTNDEAIVLDEKWRRDLDQRILDRFNLMGGDLNARNGYAG
ncbi:MAG TPA: sulfotransferase [Anaerolineales bacterium]|nr:sulfotransferase [Anaerolineales bacterium]